MYHKSADRALIGEVNYSLRLKFGYSVSRFAFLWLCLSLSIDTQQHPALHHVCAASALVLETWKLAWKPLAGLVVLIPMSEREAEE